MFLSPNNQHEVALARSLPGIMTLNFLFGFLGSAGLILLLCLGSELGRIRLRSEFSGGGAGVGEEAREDRLDDGSEQDLGATSLG